RESRPATCRADPRGRSTADCVRCFATYFGFCASRTKVVQSKAGVYTLAVWLSTDHNSAADFRTFEKTSVRCGLDRRLCSQARSRPGALGEQIEILCDSWNDLESPTGKPESISARHPGHKAVGKIRTGMGWVGQ